MALAILNRRKGPAKEIIMAELALCFREKKEYRNLTKYEINDITIAAQGASAIIHVMREYATHNPQGEDGDLLGIYGCVFNTLEWLMEPVTDYLFGFAGREAEPEKENETA
jgi:hypothetical protein